MLASSSSESELNDAQAALLEHAADDLRAQHGDDTHAGEPEILVSRSFLRLRPQQAHKLRAALVALVDKYSDEAGEGASYEMALALFRNGAERA
jgi:hypothetical protein